MCFSPQADVAGGIVVTAIGIDACRHLGGRDDRLLLAALPLLLGAHQLDEAFVWWGIEGRVPHTVGRIALWLYLLIAFVILPIFVPVAVLVLEPRPRRRRWMGAFVALGAGVSAALLFAMVRTPIAVSEESYHLAYSVHLRHGGLIVMVYAAAVCGVLLMSSYRHIEIFGVGHLVVVAALARLTLAGLPSLWCGYAALSAGAIALHIRYARPHRDASYVVT